MRAALKAPAGKQAAYVRVPRAALFKGARRLPGRQGTVHPQAHSSAHKGSQAA
jgi:hypothetical protein